MILVLDIGLLILFLEGFEADLCAILYRMLFLRLGMLLYNTFFFHGTDYAVYHPVYLFYCVVVLSKSELVIRNQVFVGDFLY